MDKERDEIFPGYRPKNGPEVFSANLAAIIKRKGLTRFEVARRASHDPSILSRILNGRHYIGIKTLTHVADAVGEDVGDLLNSRQIDSWLFEHLQVLQHPQLDTAVLTLPIESKWEILGLYQDIKAKRNKFTGDSKVDVIESLSHSGKWELRSIIEQIEEALPLDRGINH